MGRRTAAFLGALVAAGALALPAAQAATTTTTFTVSGGLLNISAPASVDFGSASAGATAFTAQLGNVQVTDNRSGLVGWTATVSSTDFTAGGATSNETIAKANVSYWSGAATASTGTGVFTPGQATALLKQDLSTSRTAFSAAAVVLNNSVTWNPTLVIDTTGAAAGDYTGTITHSAA
jgi:hypothetical protein